MPRAIEDLTPSRIVAVRIKDPLSGADPATLSDANFPAEIDSTDGGPFNCAGLATVWIGVELTGGGSVTLDLLVYDLNAAADNHWKRLLFGDISDLDYERPVLEHGDFVEMRVDGGLIYPRIDARDTATAVTFLARPGAPLDANGRYR